MRIGCNSPRTVILFYLFVFCFFFYSAGVGAREIIAVDCKYNSAEQGTTNTSKLHHSLKREPSLASLSINTAKISLEIVSEGRDEFLHGRRL